MILVTIKNTHGYVMMASYNKDILQQIDNKIISLDVVINKSIRSLDLENLANVQRLIFMYETVKHTIVKFGGVGKAPEALGTYFIKDKDKEWTLIISKVDV